MTPTLKELVEQLSEQRYMRKRHARQFLLGYIWSCLYESERQHIVDALLLSKVKNPDTDIETDTRWHENKPTPDDTPETLYDRLGE